MGKLHPVWLKRSRNAPLRLYVTLSPNKSLPFALLETVTRWDVVHLVGTDGEFWPERIVEVPVNAKLLENAKNLANLEVNLSISAEEFGSIISCLPNLKHLKISHDVSMPPGETYPLE